MGADTIHHNSAISHALIQELYRLNDEMDRRKETLKLIANKIAKSPRGSVEMDSYSLAHSENIKKFCETQDSFYRTQQLLETETEKPTKAPPPRKAIESTSKNFTFEELYNEVFADISTSVQKFEDTMLKYSSNIGSNYSQTSTHKVNTLKAAPILPEEHTNSIEQQQSKSPTRLRPLTPGRPTVPISPHGNKNLNQTTPVHKISKNAHNVTNMGSHNRPRVGGEKFCEVHLATSHNTEDCRALNGTNNFQSKKRRRLETFNRQMPENPN